MCMSSLSLLTVYSSFPTVIGLPQKTFRVIFTSFQTLFTAFLSSDVTNQTVIPFDSFYLTLLLSSCQEKSLIFFLPFLTYISSLSLLIHILLCVRSMWYYIALYSTCLLDVIYLTELWIGCQLFSSQKLKIIYQSIQSIAYVW